MHDPLAVLVDEDHRVAGDGEHPDEIRIRRTAFSSGIGHIQAYCMLRSCAPTGEAIRTKSPSLEWRRTPVDGHREEVLAQLPIVGEAAGGEDHRLARADVGALALGR